MSNKSTKLQSLVTKRPLISPETALFALLIVSAGVLVIVLLTQIIHGLPAVVEALIVEGTAENLGAKSSALFFGPPESVRNVLAIIEGVWL